MLARTISILLFFLCVIFSLKAALADQVSVQLTDQERAYLTQKGKIKYCIDPQWMPYESIDESGNHVGISADYMALIADQLGVNLVLHPTTSWKETLQSVESRQCDFITMARETDERKAYMDFSDPYISFPYVIGTTADKQYIYNLENHLDKTFALVEGYAVQSYLQKKYPSIKLLFVKNFDDGIQKLRTGEAYGYLDSLVTLGYYISEKGLLDIKVTGETDFSSSLSIATRNDEPLLAQIMQKALASISEADQSDILQRWVSLRFAKKDEGNTQAIALNIKEAAYLKHNPVVTMCVDPDWMPYEAIKNGNHTGIGGDMIRLITGRAGLKVKLIPTKTWKQSLAHFRSGQCDILSMLNQTDERDAYMDYTAPYFRGHIVFVAKNEYPYIAHPSEISGKKIAVTAGYSIAEFLKRDFKDITLIEVDNYGIAFDMVATGEADLTADYLISSGDRIQNQGLYGLKIAGNTPYKNELRIGVQKNKPELLSILDKAVATLKPQEVNAIVNQWRTVRYEQAINYTLLWQVLGAAFVIISITFFWNRRLAQARTKTQEALDKLSVAQEELEKLATTDKLTNLNNRVKLDEHLVNELHRAERFQHAFGLIMLDVDHFKSVNDTYGHQVGDSVLVELSNILKTKIRETDIPGRWGGEEFLVICPETDLDGTIKIAEKLRQNIEKATFSTVGQKTASLGVAIYQTGDSIKSILARADDALYRAKEKGRNRVEYCT